MFAPIVIFGYNRPDRFDKMTRSLMKNFNFSNHEVFVFIDGPKSDEDVMPVREVTDIAYSITDNVSISQNNKGLANSIISGVSEIIEIYGRVIVIEDDLILHPEFLNFMDYYLDKCEKVKNIISICGYGLKIKRPSNYKSDVYLARRSSSWGWATWADRWNAVDWEVRSFPEIQKSSKLKKQFNLGGSDMFSMLSRYMKGMNNSWAIRFCYHQFRNNLYSIHPVHSLVSNDGFGTEATNCRQEYNRFKTDPLHLSEKLFSVSTDPEMDDPLPPFSPHIDRQLRAYHSVPKRIYSRIRRILRF